MTNDITTHIDNNIPLDDCNRNVDMHTIMMNEHDTILLYIRIRALLLLSSTIRYEDITKQANCSQR